MLQPGNLIYCSKVLLSVHKNDMLNEDTNQF